MDKSLPNAGTQSTNTQRDDIKAWIGRTTQAVENIDAATVSRLAATLNRDDLMRAPAAQTLPPCWHWAFFNPVAAQSRLGPDGHPERGDFLPPVSLPRRMWAGSRLTWHDQFIVGQTVTKDSTILKIEPRDGRTGRMVFVTVGHEYSADGRHILSEEHDIVYRDDPGAAELAALARLRERIAAGERQFEDAGDRQHRIDPDPVVLFRYSAVTFNGHRIHYDRSYCETVEHYPGLIVHGPLIATLLVGWADQDLQPARRVRAFSFRAQRPTFDLAAFFLHSAQAEQDDSGGLELRIWSSNNVGETAVAAQVRFD